MTSEEILTRSRIHRPRFAALSVLVLAFLLLGAPSAFAIARATVLARAQVWVDRPVPYSQSKYFGSYRTDCSGFNSMSWKTTSGGHAISYSTRTLHNHATRIAARDLLPGDALVKHNYHAIVFYGWADAAHTKYVAYEQTGPWTKSSIKDLAYDLAKGYVPLRYDYITNSPPSWNVLANPTFDVWASGSPVWWGFRSDAWGGASWTQRKDRTKVSKSALGLFNPSARTRDYVEVSQTTTVTPGMPYMLSVWAVTNTAPGSVDMKLVFLDAAGDTLTTTSTTGASWSVEATSFARMSVTATAPAQATSATVTVRLAGGVDASGTAGTTAIFDDVRLFIPIRVTSRLSVAAATITARHKVTLRGTVSPTPLGTVRIYVTRPGSTNVVVLADRPLVGGAWSMPVTPTLRGTYTFTVTFLGYGPWRPAASAPVSLRVK